MSEHNYYLCPICGKHRFPDKGDEYNICPHCGWVHDAISEEDPHKAWGPNSLSMDDHKIRYLHYVELNPDYHFKRDGYPDIPQVEPIDCPVCGKFQFAPLTWDDIYCGMTPSDSYCTLCGWHYDPSQHIDPDKKEGANALSLNEYKKWYEDKLKENPDYDYFEEMTNNYVPTPHKCPVCGKYEFADDCCFDICPYCGWEDDGTEDDTTILGANDLRFSEYKERYKRYIQNNPQYKWNKDGKP